MLRTAGHFLDATEYDLSKPEAAELHDILIKAYSTRPRAELLLATSGIATQDIHMTQPMRHVWKEALDAAASAGRTRFLVQRARQDPSIAGYHARLDRLLGQSPAPAEALAPAREPVVWTGNELITGKQETFLEMSFLHEALRVSASVVRLGTTTQDHRSYAASGFLIARDTILTNHHVLHDEAGRRVRQVSIWFNYEVDAAGRVREVDSYEGDVSTIIGDAGDDWAVVRPVKAFKSGYPPLSLRPCKPVEKGDFVYIVQHPAGRTKKIGLAHNEVVSVTPGRVQYLTDTLPGSSGAPVCNEHWQVVALHQRGLEAGAEPGSIRKNQGIHIDRVVEALASRGIALDRLRPDDPAQTTWWTDIPAG